MSTTKLDGILLKKAIAGGVKYLVKNKEIVNELNVFPVPDGDTGTNMSLTAESAVKLVNEVDEPENIYKVAKAASRGSLMGARGNSGVILSQLLRGFAAALKGYESIGIKEFAEAVEKASETTYNAVMKPTEGTILTVGRELAEYAMKNYKKYDDFIEFYENLIKEANTSLDRTPELLPVLKEAGVVDAGGKGLVLILEGAYKVLTGEEITEEIVEEIQKEYTYNVEYLLKAESKDIIKFEEKLKMISDNPKISEEKGSYKIEINTDHPGKALEFAIEIGEIKEITVENIKFSEEDEEFNIDKKYSFITVSMGEGMSEVFKSFGVDHVVEGGQTMNPSTEDLLKGIDKVHGENIFILPNNGNIILAAEQAEKLSERNVFVIPSKSVPEGIAAVLAFDESIDPLENKENMIEAMKEIISAQVTYAVRDTEINGKKIKKNNIIGLSGKEILSTGESLENTTMELVENLMNDDISMVSIYYGEDVKEKDAEALGNKLEEKYEDIDVEIVCGSQPIYYYVISLE